MLHMSAKPYLGYLALRRDKIPNLEDSPQQLITLAQVGIFSGPLVWGMGPRSTPPRIPMCHVLRRRERMRLHGTSTGPCDNA